MKVRLIRIGLLLHTLITSMAGSGLFLFPQTFGLLWPWALPPLAARFMGSLLIGGSVCTALAALAPEPLPLAGPALLGLGDLLIASVGLLDLGEIDFTTRIVVWLVAFIGTALFLWVLFLLYGRQASQEIIKHPLPRSLRVYFWIHLGVVIPVDVDDPPLFAIPAPRRIGPTTPGVVGNSKPLE